MEHLSRQSALNRPLAACGACLIAYVGLLHELIGDVVFPWARAMLQGPVAWHATGLLVFCIGGAMLLGTLQLIAFPVVRWAAVMVVFGLTMGTVAQLIFHQFHFGTATLVVAGVTTIVFYRRSLQTEVQVI